MEEKIGKVRKSIGTFCNHLESSCDALRHSLDRRPIPLDSSTSTFVQCLNKRVSSASNDLNLLETMSLDTVSFEELLGHCSHLFHSNHSQLLRLRSLLPHPLQEADSDEEHPDAPPDTSGFELPTRGAGDIKSLQQEDPFTEEPLGLRRMGLSDAGLSSLACRANGKAGGNDPMTRKLEEEYHESFPTKGSQLKHEDDLRTAVAPRTIVRVSKDDYESLPSSLKCLASWEDLIVAVEKINAALGKESHMESIYLNQDDVASLGLGPKARTYLLLLKRMNLLVVENIDGSIWYKVL